MYESFFGLSQRPFAAAAAATRYFPASSIDSARETLARCVERAEGTGLVIAAPGLGKTLLLSVLAEHFRERFAVAMLASGQLASRRELLQAILFELDLPYQGLDDGELRLALFDHLSRGDACPGGMLLLVDEAHTLPPVLLEELRMVTNLLHQGEPRVRLVAAGTMALEEVFASPELESFSQRLSARCYLESFERAETRDYVRFQIAVSGGRAEQCFAADACDAVHRATDGIPRLVNQVCDHAMLLAYANERRPIQGEDIEEAWSDLQQLPTPYGASRSATASARDEGGMIEFGELDHDVNSADGNYIDAMDVDSIEADAIRQDAPAADVATTGDALPETETDLAPVESGLELDFQSAAELTDEAESDGVDALDVDAEFAATPVVEWPGDSEHDADDDDGGDSPGAPADTLRQRDDESYAEVTVDSPSSILHALRGDCQQDHKSVLEECGGATADGDSASSNSDLGDPEDQLHISQHDDVMEIVVDPYADLNSAQEALELEEDDDLRLDAAPPAEDDVAARDASELILEAPAVEPSETTSRDETITDRYAALDVQRAESAGVSPAELETGPCEEHPVEPYSGLNSDGRDEKTTLAQLIRKRKAEEQIAAASRDSGPEDASEVASAPASRSSDESASAFEQQHSCHGNGGSRREGLIVIEDDGPPEANVRAQDYRELLTRLRHGTAPQGNASSAGRRAHDG